MTPEEKRQAVREALRILEAGLDDTDGTLKRLSSLGVRIAVEGELPKEVLMSKLSTLSHELDCWRGATYETMRTLILASYAKDIFELLAGWVQGISLLEDK